MSPYLRAMSRYFDFAGRTRRSDFWWYSVLSGIPWVALYILGRSSAVAEALWLTFAAVSAVPTVAIGVRRLHDSGRSGWWMLLAVVPIAQFFLIGFWCLPSVPDELAHLNPHGSRAEPQFTSHTYSAGLVDELEKLAALRASGAIDEEEFQEMKARLIRKGAAQ